MSYRVFTRRKLEESTWSAAAFKRSKPIDSGYVAVELALMLQAFGPVDVYVHCEETDWIYDADEMLVLAKE